MLTWCTRLDGDVCFHSSLVILLQTCLGLVLEANIGTLREGLWYVCTCIKVLNKLTEWNVAGMQFFSIANPTYEHVQQPVEDVKTAGSTASLPTVSEQHNALPAHRH